MYGYDPNRVRRHHVVAGVLALLIAAVMSVVTYTTEAHADPVSYGYVNGTPDLYVKRVTPIHVNGRPAIRARLSNGAVDVLKPCLYEDGRHCYWVGDSMGDGFGRSFIVTRGIVFYVDLSGIPS